MPSTGDKLHVDHQVPNPTVAYPSLLTVSCGRNEPEDLARLAERILSYPETRKHSQIISQAALGLKCSSARPIDETRRLAHACAVCSSKIRVNECNGDFVTFSSYAGSPGLRRRDMFSASILPAKP